MKILLPQSSPNQYGQNVCNEKGVKNLLRKEADLSNFRGADAVGFPLVPS